MEDQFQKQSSFVTPIDENLHGMVWSVSHTDGHVFNEACYALQDVPWKTESDFTGHSGQTQTISFP